MIKSLKRSAYRNGYLVITAAWLYTLSIIFINYWSYSSSPGRVKHRLEQYIADNEKTFGQFVADTPVLRAIVNQTTRTRLSQWMEEDKPRLFVYIRNDIGNPLLTFWNTHQVVPENTELEAPDGKRMVTYPNGEFETIKKTFILDGRELVAIGMIPIRWNYSTQNTYLKTSFEAIKDLEKRYTLIHNGGNISIKNGDGTVLFSLQEKVKKNKDYYDSYTLTLRILAIILVLIFINSLALDVVKQHGALKGMLFLGGIIFLIRTLSYFIPLPFNYSQFGLFDPFVYASNAVHPSLGDLLINMVLLFWIISFFKLSSLDYLTDLKSVTGKRSWVFAILLSMLLVLMSFVAAGVVRSLIIDAKIPFDVTHFFSLNIYTFISFLILCFITLTFFNFSHIILLLYSKLTETPNWGRYLLVTLCGLVYLTFTISSGSVTSNLVVLGWLLLYMLIMEKRKEDLYKPLMRSSFFLLWVIFFAASISAIIIYQNSFIEYEVRKRKAGELALQNDPSGQTILSIGVINLTNNFLAENFVRFTSPAVNKLFKDSIITENFSGFVNKYDTEIYTYDKDLQPLFNEDSTGMEVISSIIVNGSKKTGIPEFYYYQNNDEGYSYILEKTIRGTAGDVLGYFYLNVKPKQYKSDALYLELFKQVKDVNPDQGTNYAYAVYDKGKLLANSGDYNFLSVLPREMWPKQETVETLENDKVVLWYNAGNNKIVVIIKSGTLLFEVITLFAYLFGSFLFILILFHLGDLMLRTRFKWWLIKDTFRFNIRNQIQTTILFISLFSFVVIGFATISFYISRFETSNRERLVNAIQIMAKEIQGQVLAHQLSGDVEKIYDEGANNMLSKTIEDISEIHNADVNFYDIDGNLKVSTQSYVYKKQIVSDMMNPLAYRRLHFNNEMQVIQNETIGLFKYLSVYVPIRNEAGEPYAFINIPYLNSQRELNQEISNFLVTLINLNAFIFVLAGVIAILLTNRITASFSLIGSKMKDVNLGKVNEEISWDTNDEIGALVSEYNKMVHKLEESAQALAKSEREGAWREMARQVAHEIKNPLTPMKLSIQYLQRSIAENRPGIQRLSQRVAATLVEQIDQLAKIASDFSQFANIEYVKDEMFNINEVLSSLMDLYNANEVINIQWQKPDGPMYIKADKTQVNRLFTNLLQNAIEASTAEGKTEIQLRQLIDEEGLLISITDEGTGIPVDRWEKIFTPNFTTKSSGTGLGLAICKGIVEKANGSIWFETEEHIGTTFHVRFPLVNVGRDEEVATA